MRGLTSLPTQTSNANTPASNLKILDVLWRWWECLRTWLGTVAFPEGGGEGGGCSCQEEARSHPCTAAAASASQHRLLPGLADRTFRACSAGLPRDSR